MDKTTTVFGEQPMRIVLTMTGILLFLGVASARADQVTLKNGDRLSGAIVKADGKTLLLKTDYAGDLTLKWSAVDAFTSTQPVHVDLAGGQTVRGTVTGAAGREEIDTEASGKRSESLEAIAAIRNDAEETAYEANQRRLSEPHLTDFWSSFFDAGISLTRGNADNLSVAVQGKAIREAPRNKFTVHGAYVVAKSTAAGVTSTTANEALSELRDDISLTDHFFVFGSSDFEHNPIQLLNFRYVLDAGAGYHVIKSMSTTFDLFGGGSYKQDQFSTGLIVKSPQALVGDELDYKLNDRAGLSERLTFYPDLSHRGEYFVTLDTTATTKLYKWISWQVTFSDRYLTNPVPGTLKNDLLLTTGLRLTFGKAAAF
jgi:putative salt-induced outer membrane protein YdiY